MTFSINFLILTTIPIEKKPVDKSIKPTPFKTFNGLLSIAET